MEFQLGASQLGHITGSAYVFGESQIAVYMLNFKILMLVVPSCFFSLPSMLVAASTQIIKRHQCYQHQSP